MKRNFPLYYRSTSKMIRVNGARTQVGHLYNLFNWTDQTAHFLFKHTLLWRRPYDPHTPKLNTPPLPKLPSLNHFLPRCQGHQPNLIRSKKTSTTQLKRSEPEIIFRVITDKPTSLALSALVCNARVPLLYPQAWSPEGGVTPHEITPRNQEIFYKHAKRFSAENVHHN